MSSRFGLLGVVILLLSMLQVGVAAGKHESGYPYATIRKTCGPVDNPELVLILTKIRMTCNDKRKPARFISIYLDGWSLPNAVSLPMKDSQPESYRYGQGGNEKVKHDLLRKGRLTITDKRRKGHYDLIFEDGDVEKGDFQLTQCMSQIMCP